MVVSAMLGAFAQMAEARGVVDRTKPSVRGILRSPNDVPSNQDAVDGIAVRHIRLEAATPVDGSPSVVLKFDVHNEGSANVTDIVLSVSLRKSDSAEPVEPARVQPFTIKLRNVVLAGYSVDYEIRLRNVSLEAANSPVIEVVDARRAADDPF